LRIIKNHRFSTDLNKAIIACFTMAKKASSNDEQVGFHKGALTTLAKEREEMMKILQIVEQLMQMHIKSLKDLGVDLAQAAKDMKGSDKKSSKKQPIEDMLK
jgi:Trp operon repressor